MDKLDMTRRYWVYMMASRKNGTLYIGVTSNVAQRAHQHRTKARPGFAARYDITRLVWYEEYSDIHEAITREKMMKRWERAWKIKLIEAFNPDWRDLYLDLNR